MDETVYTNRCYRNGPCLHGDPIEVSKESHWDYYDKSARSYIYLRCRLNQKYYSPSFIQIEEANKLWSGLSTTTSEIPDHQLADTNGVWFTRSEDPEMYLWPPDLDTPKICSSCDIICEIRGMAEYMKDDGSCPYEDALPLPIYSKVDDADRACQDYLHPLLLQDLRAINRRRARVAKAKIGRYLHEAKWRHALINSGQRMIDVWRRNYNPVTFYFNSFESIVLYIKNLPSEVKRNKHLLRRIRENLELSPSFKVNLEKGDWERRMLKNIDRHVE